MIYLKSIKASLCFLIFSFFSINSFAQLKPYVAAYDIYSNGFHLGEATQTLTQQGGQWLISLSSKATGFASLFQSNPAMEEQLFTLKEQKVLLISAKSDSGENEEDAKASAYYDMKNQLIYIRIGNKTKQIKHHSALSSFLLLPITAAALHEQQTIEVSLYDEGEVIKKTVSRLSDVDKKTTVDVYSSDSDKKLRYTFKNNNVQVPFRIERFKNNEITAYLELISFN